MKKIFYLITIVIITANNTYSQFVNSGTTPNTTNLTTGGSVGIGTGLATPTAKLEILNSSNKQLRISNTTTKFADIQTTSNGDLILKPTSTGIMTKVGLGTYAPVTGFHSNLGLFRITDSTSATRGVQISPNTAQNGELPGGSFIQQISPTSGDGLSLVPYAGGTAGVKLGAYAFCGYGWKSMWETSNMGTSLALPNMLLVKNGGNVGIGTGATAPAAKLDIIGQIKITDGTQGLSKVLTSDANGLASWQTLTGVLSGGTTNYIPKWSSANSLSSMSLIYDNGTNVGIGTNTPYKKLNVNGDLAFLGINGNNALEILGNGAIPSRRGISLDNDPSGKFNFYIHGWQTNASFNFKDGNGDKTLVSISAIGATTFSVIPTSPTIASDAIILKDATTSVTNFKVKTDGKVYATEVNVQLTPFPDYVFNKDYKLTPIKEVEKFINENHHLKGFESAQTYEKNGVNVSEVIKLQQEKIEELTLYLIEQQKQLEQLKKEINSLK